MKKQMRQKDPTFIQQMDRLGNNTYTEDDFYSWQESMDLNAMTPERQKLFTEKGTMLVGEKKQMGTFNEEGIRRLKEPVCRSAAVNNCAHAKNSKPADADNLYNEMFLAKGVKVVLTRNLWSEAGLVNGSQGFVKYIIYAKDNPTTADAMPEMLLVHFPGYKGPSYLNNGEESVVPIFPTTAVWYTSTGQLMTRKQFPLLYGYAITIHKSQGKL